MTQELGLHRPAPSVQRTWGIRLGWLALVLAALLYCGVRLHDGTALQTNLLSLLPDTEADPVAEKAVDTLAASLGDRTVFLLSSRNADHAKAAAMQFGSQLKRSKAFRNVIAELPPFDAATVALARTAAALTREDSLVSVAGGGDTVAALNHAGVAAEFTYVSTAGGAFLEWMEGKELPGVAALQQNA